MQKNIALNTSNFSIFYEFENSLRYLIEKNHFNEGWLTSFAVLLYYKNISN